MIAHLFIHNGRLAWSGYNACGDPLHTHALVVDAGRDFFITSDGTLYLIGPGPRRFDEFTPAAFALAARNGLFGFRVLMSDESLSSASDRRSRQRRKLGRRGSCA